jgi:hypothetical protein
MKKGKQTQGALFRRQVDDLMGTLLKTRASFIRCIKPNTEKRALNFHGQLCYEQLQCSGVFEAVTIRRQGYPARLTHAQFYRKFRTLASLSPDSSPLNSLRTVRGVPDEPRRAAELLIQVLSQQPALARMKTECQMGKTPTSTRPRTDINKAITLVRADVEKKRRARSRCSPWSASLSGTRLSRGSFKCVTSCGAP